MSHDTWSDKITAYLRGKLSPQEARQFEVEMSQNPVLTEAVEIHRLEEDALDELLRQDMERQISGWITSSNELPEPPSTAATSMGNPRPWTDRLHWIFGLAMLLSLAGAFWLWNGLEAERSRTKILEEQLQNERLEKEAAQQQAKQAQEDLRTLQIPDLAKPSPQENKPASEKISQPSTTQPIAASYPELLDTNATSDFYAALDDEWDQSKGNHVGTQEDLEHFEVGKNEFFKKDRNAAIIKENLRRIPTEQNMYPYAQAMLADVYFREKNYRNALLSFEKYAALDHSAATTWRLLQFRLAAYPYQKNEFWVLLDKFCQNNQNTTYQNKAIQLKSNLKKLGVVPR